MHHNLRQRLQVLWQGSFLRHLSFRATASCCRPSSQYNFAHSSVLFPNLCWACSNRKRMVLTMKYTIAPTGCADIHGVFSFAVAAAPGCSCVSVVSVFSAAASGYAYCRDGGRPSCCPSRVMPPDRGRARGRVVPVFDPHRRDVLRVVLCRYEDPQGRARTRAATIVHLLL